MEDRKTLNEVIQKWGKGAVYVLFKNSDSSRITNEELDKYLNCYVELFKDIDIDSQGNDYGVLWGRVYD